MTLFDGKESKGPHDLAVAESSLHLHSRNLDEYLVTDPPSNNAPGDFDPVLDVAVNRCIRSLFTGRFTDGLAAVVDFGKARRKN